MINTPIGNGEQGGPMSNFGNTKTVVVRKMHRCNVCFGPIGRGEACSYWSGIWDAEWGRTYYHQECAHQSKRDGYGDGNWPDRVKAYWRPFVGEPLQSRCTTAR
jgi:hypothetical protein